MCCGLERNKRCRDEVVNDRHDALIVAAMKSLQHMR